jgi:hypothetical protein
MKMDGLGGMLFSEDDNELPVTPKNEKTGGDKPRPYGIGGKSASSVGAGFTPARHFQKNYPRP